MANAKQCDRCGKFFDPYKMNGMSCKFQNPLFQTSNDIREGVVGKLMINGSPDIYVDLCPECAELFEAFMCCCDIPKENEKYHQLMADYEREKQRADDYGDELNQAYKHMANIEQMVKNLYDQKYKKEIQDEKENIKPLASDMLGDILSAVGLGDLVRGKGRRDRPAQKTSGDGKTSEREVKSEQKGDDRSEI